MNPDMKKNDLITYLKSILEYPRPSQNLYAKTYDIDQNDIDINNSVLFRKLLYIKQYNSLLDAKGMDEFVLTNTISKNIKDDDKIQYDGTLTVSYVPFDSHYFGILSDGDKKTLVNTENPNILVGIKTRNTILFESYDQILHIDIHKDLSRPTSLNFTRFKCHTTIFREFCIEQSKKSLRTIYKYLKILGNKSNIKKLCSEFISVKNRLFFGGKNIDFQSLGNSLLFYNRFFKDNTCCNKTKEYIQYTLSENLVPPNQIFSCIFLFETICFINCLNKRDEDDVLFNPIKEYEDDMPINLTTTYSYIMSDTTIDNNFSKCHNKIFSIYCRILDLFNSNLHIYLKKEDISNMIKSVLSQKRFYKYEVLGLVTYITSINNIFKSVNHKQVKKNISQKNKSKVNDAISKLQIKNSLEMLEVDLLSNYSENKNQIDYDLLARDLLDLIQGIIKRIREENNLENFFDLLIDLYNDLVYIDNKIMIDIYSCGILRTVNSFNLDNMRKISKYRNLDTKCVTRLHKSKLNYDLERKLCKIMNIDIDPTYSTLEKKALLRISKIKEVTKGSQIPKIIQKGNVLNEEMFKRYKIYIYEYLKEINMIKDYEIYFT